MPPGLVAGEMEDGGQGTGQELGSLGDTERAGWSSLLLGRGVPVFLPFNSSGADEKKFPCTFGRGQCPLVMALGCTQKGKLGSHGERLSLRWSFGVTEGIHASADLGTL